MFAQMENNGFMIAVEGSALTASTTQGVDD
jgi:hypothetical protein